ncbi:MAG: hypothetical protein PHP86_03830 [Nevskiales bacterium]|nr:hypothetical protein [Nevskiales bacterium]
MSRKLRRHEGRFAAIPVEVMTSEAWRTLPHGARSVLTVLAAQFNGIANGVQNLSRETCRRYGLDHSRALKATKGLEERGLIVCTYRARYTKSRARIPSQWAVTWRNITHRNNDILPRSEKAPDLWREWRPTKKQSGQNDRSDSMRAGEMTAEEMRDCGHSALRNPKNCGRIAQPSKNLGALPALGATAAGGE